MNEDGADVAAIASMSFLTGSFFKGNSKEKKNKETKKMMNSE